jgi:uncharacterized protein (DUF427 family)
MTFRATWKQVTLAESDDVKVVEGNVYFPPEAVKRDYLFPSETHTRCFWKGKANYYNVIVDGEVNPDAAWYYPKPWPLARNLQGYVAFWRGVRVRKI